MFFFCSYFFSPYSLFLTRMRRKRYRFGLHRMICISAQPHKSLCRQRILHSSSALWSNNNLMEWCSATSRNKGHIAENEMVMRATNTIWEKNLLSASERWMREIDQPYHRRVITLCNRSINISAGWTQTASGWLKILGYHFFFVCVVCCSVHSFCIEMHETHKVYCDTALFLRLHIYLMILIFHCQRWGDSGMDMDDEKWARFLGRQLLWRMWQTIFPATA